MDQFWSNKILVLLCQGPKRQNSMMSGFFDPETLICGFYYNKLLQQYKSNMETISQVIIFVNRGIKQFVFVWKSRCWFLLLCCVFVLGKFRVSHFLANFVKMGTRKWWRYCSISSKSWIWISYISKNMKWKFANFCIFK